MKIAPPISRYLLGIVFLIFGLNGFLHFIPMGRVPPLALQFVGAMVQSHYMDVVFLIEIGSGLLLLSNRFVPLAATLLAPVIVNIDLFHICMAPGGLPLAFVVSVVWAVLAYSVRTAFAGIFTHHGGAATAGPRIGVAAHQQ